jgi:TPR repeat protein
MQKLISVLCFFLLSSVSYAESLEKAIEAYNTGKYKVSAEILANIADSSSRAKAFLCLHYIDGLIDNKARGNVICQEAVVAKEPTAIFIWARVLIDGNSNINVSKDFGKGLGFMSVAVIDFDFAPAYDFFCEYYASKEMHKQAASFCKVGASQQMRRSQTRLANLYTQGQGVLQDHKKALDLLLHSAGQHHAPAYEILGDIFSNGTHGQNKDPIQAYAWYSLAASVRPEKRVESKQAGLKLSSDQLAAATKLSKTWVYREPKFANYFRN